MEAQPPSQLRGPCVCRDPSSVVSGLTQRWLLLKGAWDSGDAPAVHTVKDHGIWDSHHHPGPAPELRAHCVDASVLFRFTPKNSEKKPQRG